MEFDQMPPIVQRAFSLAVQGWDIASAWLLSPAAWSQFILLVAAYYGAVFATKEDEPNHHPHPDTTGRFNIGHCANTPFYIDVFTPFDAVVGLCLYRHR